jgi:hypothetical protein
MKFPRTPDSAKNGWQIDPKFLRRIQDFFSAESSDYFPSMEGVELVLLALENMEQMHDSDCAMHNMPAMPNGECDCSVSTDRQKTKEINILTKENRALLEKVKLTENRAKADREVLELTQMEIKMRISKAIIYPQGDTK